MLQTEFNFQSLMVRGETGQYRPVSSEEVIEAALAEMWRRFARGHLLSNPADARRFLQLRLAPFGA